MRVPVGPAVRAVRTLLPITRTWRLRDAARPADRPAIPDEPAVYAVWHEHLLPALALFRDRGFATLVSLSRDGEIVARVLAPLAHVARGSSSSGGTAGLRALVRAGREGRSIVLTPDGPRGPRHSVAEGIVRVAALTGLPIVPVGFGAATAARLSSWDRCLVPAPGSAVFVSRGAPIPVPREGWRDPMHREAVGRALARQNAWADVVAAEAREGGPLACRPLEAAGPRRAAPGPWRRALERWLRAAWIRTPPPASLRAAARTFALARDLRHALYDTGLLATERAPLAVVSVGGATIGGSGKTPLAAALAGMLEEHGTPVAILTRGYPDEVALHARLRPGTPVWGHRDRARLATRAGALGARVAILDDGFQHRRLARDLEVLALDRDALRRSNGWPLPAGPFREDVERAVRRSDVVVTTGREPWDEDAERFDRDLHDRLAPLAPDATFATVHLMDAAPRPINEAARTNRAACPAIALTGIMKPNLFFERTRATFASIRIEHAVPDHAEPAPEEWAGLVERAGKDGFVMTPKDAVRLAHRIPEGVPAWVVPERLVWVRGEAAVGARLAELAARARSLEAC